MNAHLEHYFASLYVGHAEQLGHLILIMMIFFLVTLGLLLSVQMRQLQIEFSQEKIGRIQLAVEHVHAQNVTMQVVQLKLHRGMPLGVSWLYGVCAELLRPDWAFAECSWNCSEKHRVTSQVAKQTSFIFSLIYFCRDVKAEDPELPWPQSACDQSPAYALVRLNN